MDNSKQSKQILLSVIGVAILVVAVVGVSFAFFNYTRSGQENTVQTGKIWFTSSQSGALSVTNFFPQRPGTQDTANTSVAHITVSGGTTYANGMTYRLRAVDVKSNNAAYDGTVPILLDVAAETATGSETGVNDTDHGTFTAATGTGTGGGVGTGIVLAENAILGTGTITGNEAATSTWMNGKIQVTAYIDANVAITDTLTTDTAPEGYQNGTTTDWVNGRTRLTTAQWNELAEHPVTFRILVEAIETGGTYVS